MKQKTTPPVPSEFYNKIIRGDCIEIMRKMPEKSVDLLFADPPYNLQLKGTLRRPNRTVFKGVNEDWDKFGSIEEYKEFTIKWLTEAKRVLKPTGSIWAIGMYHNIHLVGSLMQDIGFWFINHIIWHKLNATPNFSGTRFANLTETLIWATHLKTFKTFRYHTMKMLNDEKQMTSFWEIPICNGGERIKDIHNETAHPTQKPEALLERVIKATSNPGDLVLDIFSGTGTTLAVAKRLGRNYIGIEKDANYVKIIRARVKKVKPIDDIYGDVHAVRKPPKVAFGALLESKMIKIGEILYSTDQSVQAHVNADGTVTWENKTASIHKISALAQNVDAYNGWQFWHIMRRKNLISIDDIREKYRQKYLKGEEYE